MKKVLLVSLSIVGCGEVKQGLDDGFAYVGEQKPHALEYLADREKALSDYFADREAAASEYAAMIEAGLSKYLAEKEATTTKHIYDRIKFVKAGDTTEDGKDGTTTTKTIIIEKDGEVGPMGPSGKDAELPEFKCKE